MSNESTHLGDGAYVSFTGYDFTVTANHHDPRQASDTVYLEAPAARAMVSFIEKSIGKAGCPAHALLKEIVDQYNASPDGPLGKGFTCGPFLRAREYLAEVTTNA